MVVQRRLGQGWLQAAWHLSSPPGPLLVHLASNLDQAGERLGPVDALDGGWHDVLPTAHLVLGEQLSVAVRRPVDNWMFLALSRVFTCIETSLSRLCSTCQE